MSLRSAWTINYLKTPNKTPVFVFKVVFTPRINRQENVFGT
jgi:hypothetical protein